MAARSAWQRGIWPVVLSLAVQGGCVPARRGTTTPAAGRVACPAADGSEIDRVCREDRSIETLRARFRATVSAGASAQVADGILLVRRPGAVRMKLFGLGGMTVYDAVWVGDDRIVRGFIRRPLTGEPISVELRPGDRLDEPDAELSFALWSLWRPRCVEPPTTVAAEPGWLRLEPYSAHATARDVRVGDVGVDEERLVRADGRAPDVLEVRYLERDCTQPTALPTRIEMTSRERGWRASVRIFEQEENPDLSSDLFALPGPEHGV